MQRVVVFVDYQSTYEDARRAFCPLGAAFTDGQFDPLAYAQHLNADSSRARTLTQVRLYRGQPDSTKQPTAYAANRRQIAAWEASGCKVFKRTLRYPSTWPKDKPEEKGIDVQLAIDFVMMAWRKEYDVGILCSTDTDLKPALEAVSSLPAGFPHAEVASWRTLWATQSG